MLKSDLNSLIDPDWPKAPTPLSPAPDRAQIAAVRAKSGDVSSAPSEGTDGDQIGDEVFTEQSRETQPVIVTSTTDPTLEIEVEAITKFIALSADGRTVEFNFTPPE